MELNEFVNNGMIAVGWNERLLAIAHTRLAGRRDWKKRKLERRSGQV